MTNNTVCEEGVLGHGDKRYRGTMESYFGKGTKLKSFHNNLRDESGEEEKERGDIEQRKSKSDEQGM
jgi:hypothetical protein